MKAFGLHDYKARYYDPRHGFMQADPIGYGDEPNIYPSVKGDPIPRRPLRCADAASGEGDDIEAPSYRGRGSR
jgi:hypothetical protein